MNFKKLFPEKKVSQKKVLDFFDKKGFYIVLALCLTVIGVTAAYIARNNATTSNNYGNEEIISPEMASNISTDDAKIKLDLPQELGDGKLTQAANVTTNKDDKLSKAVESPKPVEKSKKSETQKEEKESTGKKTEKKTEATKAPGKTNKSTSSKTVANKNSLKFVMPVIGETALDFANTTLVYSKTLDKWSAHNGIDMKADRGTPVKAAADGVVSEVKEDPKLGFTVIIEHSGGIKTVYSNLAGIDMVTPNQKIMQGEVIGAVGSTAMFESADAPHLHFEVLKDNKNVNPGNYLPAAGDKKAK